MFVINSTASKFIIGKHIIIIKAYVNGNIKLNIGDRGIVKGAHFMSLPDMGLFNIRVVDLVFGNQVLHIGDQIAEEYMDTLWLKIF